MNVLFVCRGNVARSQMAEALLKKQGGDLFKVSSAGTKLSGPEQSLGELGPQLNEVLSVMREVGIDLSGQIRRQLTEEMAEAADKIVLVVDEQDPIPDWLVSNPKVVYWDVLDPKGKDLECTRAVRDQIALLVDQFIRENK